MCADYDVMTAAMTFFLKGEVYLNRRNGRSDYRCKNKEMDGWRNGQLEEDGVPALLTQLSEGSFHSYNFILKNM